MIDVGWVLWAGTLGLEGDVARRLEAAAAVGCSRVSMSPLDVALAEEAGGSALDLGRAARAGGLDVVLDPVMNWYPGAPAPGSRFSRFTAEESLRIAADLEAVSMTVIAHRTGQTPADEMVEPFGRLCDQAAELGVDVHLEFIPMTEVRDLRSAWTIVSGADRRNGGILFDTWHFFRGDPDLNVLAAIPGDRIFAVQVDDARATPLPSLWDDTRERLLPGDGDLDLVGALRALDARGGLSWVGPEVISSSSAKAAESDPVGVAHEAMDRTRALVAEARA